MAALVIGTSDAERDRGGAGSRAGLPSAPPGRAARGVLRWVLGSACVLALMLLLAGVSGAVGSDDGGSPPELVWICVSDGAPGSDLKVYDAPSGAAIAGLQLSNVTDLNGDFSWVRISQLWVEPHESWWDRTGRLLGLWEAYGCGLVKSKTWHYGAGPPRPSKAPSPDGAASGRHWIALRRR